MKNVVIVGGGISGLLTSIQLINADVPCTVIEKKRYPFHRVCGEYISNEAVPFLKSLGLFPEEYNPPKIQRFQLSSITGRNEILPLDLGGFGISRYTFDNLLYEKARNAGVRFYLQEEVDKIQFTGEKFFIRTQVRELNSDIAIGAFGKRSKLDIFLKRSFTQKRSPYVGIKYHINTEHPDDLIALHNFKGGYCGISNVEDGKTNLCYLAHREQIRKFKNVGEMEREILYQNPLLKEIFLNSKFIWERPETINEISFETKSPVDNHMLMAGDAAGMITPLCGNGMAMAIRSSKILSETLISHIRNNTSRWELEREYADGWNRLFKSRLWFGRQVQKLFGNHWASNMAVNIAIHVRPVANLIIRGTHGEPFA